MALSIPLSALEYNNPYFLFRYGIEMLGVWAQCLRLFPDSCCGRVESIV